jgi:hypothetical protein
MGNVLFDADTAGMGWQLLVMADLPTSRTVENLMQSSAAATKLISQ